MDNNNTKLNDNQNWSVVEWLNQADLCITGAISNSKDIPVSGKCDVGYRTSSYFKSNGQFNC